MDALIESMCNLIGITVTTYVGQNHSLRVESKSSLFFKWLRIGDATIYLLFYMAGSFVSQSEEGTQIVAV
jgi:hypothetical protein